MKTTRTLVLGILVVLCFGLLWAFHGLAKSAPASQDQQVLSSAQINADHQVDLVTAVRFINNYKSNIKAPSIKGGFFARSAFDKILAQTGVVGIRYYYAQMDDGSPTLVLVGVDAKGQDIQTGSIMEKITPCPPFCDVASEFAK
ncbi:MAG: hypothetical protein ABSA44_08620 [Bacteroidota bacterium]|jgi:hypothetical protein